MIGGGLRWWPARARQAAAALAGVTVTPIYQARFGAGARRVKAALDAAGPVGQVDEGLVRQEVTQRCDGAHSRTRR